LTTLLLFNYKILVGVDSPLFAENKNKNICFIFHGMYFFIGRASMTQQKIGYMMT
jgi:hypothetical protein